MKGHFKKFRQKLHFFRRLDENFPFVLYCALLLCSRHYCLPTQNLFLLPLPCTFLNRTLTVQLLTSLPCTSGSGYTASHGQSQGYIRCRKASLFLRAVEEMLYPSWTFLSLWLFEGVLKPHCYQCENEEKLRMTQWSHGLCCSMVRVSAHALKG